MLGIIIPLVEPKFEATNSFIDSLVYILSLSDIHDYEILIVHQSNITYYVSPFKNCTTISTSTFSVSHARNLGIDFFYKKAKYLYFLDHDAFPSISFLTQSRLNIIKNLDLWSSSIQWSAPTLDLALQTSDFTIKNLSSAFIPYHQFISCFIIKSKLINDSNIRFNENLGPGKNTLFKSGEDTLFLAELLSVNSISHFLFYRGLSVYHPPRPIDNIKSIEYAPGTVYTYKLILFSSYFSKRIRFSSFIYLHLFIINSLKKIFLLETNALKLFKIRLSSLLNVHV